MTDTKPNKATVETLTAEVRALMIGKRQVTLSVYRQLDFADYSEVEPFGRVRAGDQYGYVYVVGKLRANGSLVRSRVRNPDVHYLNDLAARLQFDAAAALPLIVLAGLR